jgi:predicted nucleic acid-binding Zn ribbon protein
MEEIGKILPKVLRPQFSRLEPPVIEVLTPLWGQVAGEALAKQSRPTAFSAGTLTLATTDPEWTVPLRQMADEIRTHVNRFLGKPVVRQIRIECIHELSRGNTAHRGLESLAVSEPGDWRRHRPAISGAVPVGRSRVK